MMKAVVMKSPIEVETESQSIAGGSKGSTPPSTCARGPERSRRPKPQFPRKTALLRAGHRNRDRPEVDRAAVDVHLLDRFRRWAEVEGVRDDASARLQVLVQLRQQLEIERRQQI